ncbi:histone-lysine N-methyltransferase NSD2 [Prorops nasuta]|uniref:histone-lysine N-methyltransferase NSD2 n=1 Tax=Prorops nasuta TaxID=863751 RepID=UPI0034CDBC19
MNFDRVFESMQEAQATANIEEEYTSDCIKEIISDESVEDNNLYVNDEECMDNWDIGQVAWARMGNYPFWPCIVTNDPVLQIHSRIKTKGFIRFMEIHVHFFGDNGRHNWISACPTSVLNFTTLGDFRTLAKTLTAEHKKRDPKYASAFIVKPGLKEKWNEAVYEATHANSLSIEKRSTFFTKAKGGKTHTVLKKLENYAENLNDSMIEASTSGVNKENIASSSSQKYTTKKLYKLRGAIKIYDNNTNVGDFKSYYHRMRDSIRDEHPNITDNEIKIYLKKVWDNASSSVKSYFP